MKWLLTPLLGAMWGALVAEWTVRRDIPALVGMFVTVAGAIVIYYSLR